MSKTAPKPDPRLVAIRDSFHKNGVTVKAWAEAHGFNRMTVVDVLRGHRVGNYGEAHRVAVALGLKQGAVSTDPKKFKPAKQAA